ncbi:MAG: hypothetical protein H7328_04585 [Bdellovibrio sp.]|nr:hypothetical protein [Bdellovibrio sp.]
MTKSFLTLLIFAFQLRAAASSAIFAAVDFSAEKLAALVNKSDCNNSQRLFQNRTCLKNYSISSLGSLEQVGDRVIYSKLAKYKIDQLTCSVQRWSDLSEPSFKDSQAVIVEAMNTQLPILEKIKKEIGSFAMNNRNPGLKYQNDKSLNPEKRSELIKAANNAVEQELELMRNQYEFEMTKVPFGNSEAIKLFIERKLSGPFSQLGNIKLEEFQKFASKVKENLESEKAELVNNLKVGNFSSKQEEKLITDEGGLSALIESQPGLTDGALTLQCKVEKRLEGKRAASAGVTVASTLLTGGGLALVKGVHLAVAINNIERAATLAKFANFTTIAGLTIAVPDLIFNTYSKCLTQNYKQTKSSCNVDLEKIAEDRRVAVCLQAIALASLPAGGALAKKLFGSNSMVVQKVNEATNLKNVRKPGTDSDSLVNSPTVKVKPALPKTLISD